VVAITGDEESNVLISLLSKGLGAKRAITRISKLSYIPLVSAIGIDTVVSPRLSAVRAILQHIRRGKIVSVAPLKGEHAEAIEAEALETSDIVNVPPCGCQIPKGAHYRGNRPGRRGYHSQRRQHHQAKRPAHYLRPSANHSETGKASHC